MIYIKDLLNKIKWDKNLKKEDYIIYYFDRITKKLNEIKFIDIKRIDGSFIVIENNNEETFIPMHRIREVRKQGKLVWRRVA